MIRKCISFLKWLLVPHNPLLRKIYIIILILSLGILIRGAYRYHQIRCQEALLLEERQKLQEERTELENKKQDLQDDTKLEQKARDELGLVKPGEVPYVR